MFAPTTATLRPPSEPLHEPPRQYQTAAIEELVNSSDWAILPMQVQRNWQQRLNALRGRLMVPRCKSPVGPMDGL